MDCYAFLREKGGLINFRLTEAWLRDYQVRHTLLYRILCLFKMEDTWEVATDTFADIHGVAIDTNTNGVATVTDDDAVTWYDQWWSQHLQRSHCHSC